jgi:hypothetical protein
MTDLSIPKFGEPRDELPGISRSKVPEEYWEGVIEHAKSNHGTWIPLLNCTLSKTRLQNISYGMKSGSKRRLDVPPPLRFCNGLQARWYAGQIYFRYDKPEES